MLAASLKEMDLMILGQRSWMVFIQLRIGHCDLFLMTFFTVFLLKAGFFLFQQVYQAA